MLKTLRWLPLHGRSSGKAYGPHSVVIGFESRPVTLPDGNHYSLYSVKKKLTWISRWNLHERARDLVVKVRGRLWTGECRSKKLADTIGRSMPKLLVIEANFNRWSSCGACAEAKNWTCERNCPWACIGSATAHERTGPPPPPSVGVGARQKRPHFSLSAIFG